MHVNTRSHARLVIIIIDTTVWPADQEYLENIIDKSSDLAHGSGNTLLLSLAPQLHAKVTVETNIKRTRWIEDLMLRKNLSLKLSCPVLYDINDAHGSDARPLQQLARLCTSSQYDIGATPWADSRAVKSYRMDAVPLIKPRDMVLADRGPAGRDRKLSPAERTAQRGMNACKSMVLNILDGINFNDGDKVLLVDTMAAFPLEWGQAAASI